MMSIVVKYVMAALAVAGSFSAACIIPASAYEPGYPGFIQPPGSAIPLVATDPPPGLYGALIGYRAELGVIGPGAPFINGKRLPIDITAAIPALLWVPGVTVFGGNYSASISQTFAHNQAGPPANSSANGLRNTIIFPFQLGYKISDTGLFVKVGLGFAPPTGTTAGPSGLGAGSIGNPWYTFIPRATATYINGDYKFSTTVQGEINSSNELTKYRTGNILRVESSIIKNFGQFTIGPIANYIGQVSNDRSSAFYNLSVGSNRFTRVGVGGFVGYDFGTVSLSGWVLKDVYSDASGGTPLPTTRDRASIGQGLSVFTAVNFKIY